MKTGEATCRLNHANQWLHEGRINPCAHCYSIEAVAGDIATAYRLDRFATGRVIDEKGAGAQPNLH